MKNVSAKKLSVLGMVLMAASAVTAAIIPGKSSEAKFEGSVDNGTRLSVSGIGGGGGAFSCVADSPQDLVFSCHITAATVTTGTQIASDALANLTMGNTSDSTPGNGRDSTSRPNAIE